jgi:hypothetical protein
MEMWVPSDATDEKGRSYPFNVILAELETRLTVDLSERDEQAVITALVKTFALAQGVERRSMAERLNTAGIDFSLTGSWDWNGLDAWAARYADAAAEPDGT